MNGQRQRRPRGTEVPGRPRAPPTGRSGPLSLGIIAARHHDGHWHVMAAGAAAAEIANKMFAPRTLIARALDQLSAMFP